MSDDRVALFPVAVDPGLVRAWRTSLGQVLIFPR
jgi:hypothetical protein